MTTLGGRNQPTRADSRPHDKPRVKRLESENRRLVERIAELERELAHLRDFAGTTAHEVIKPLVMNEACAMSIRERTGHGLDLASRQELDSIIHVAGAARLLVEALLLDARDSNAELPRQPVDLTKVVRDCIAMLGPDIAARDASVEVEPLPVVSGNAALLRGVFGNLLANAIKFGPWRGSQIRVAAALVDGQWVLTVEGSGSAIAESERQSIFEPWRRGTSSGSAPGVGLGLALVRRIVQRHGGEVGVTSPDPDRNRFFFTLPA